jgi:protein-tyrosine kinase
MSRIHEALQKARNQQAGSTQDLPDTDEIIVTGTSWAAPPAPGSPIDPLAPVEPLEILRPPTEEVPALVTQCPRSEWNFSADKLVFLSEDSRASGQEQFRTLRSRLYQIRGKGSVSVLVVSSAVPDEGKSFVSCNLTHAFALQSGRRALIIDADLRRADGSTALLGAPEAPGLTDYIDGDKPLSAVLQTGPIENLYLIACGKRVSNPGELVADPKFANMIEQLRPNFDWIVIDTPPVLPVADARVVAELADGVLLVVNASSTHAQLAKRAVAEFHAERILGVVLNKTQDVAAHYYASYGYGTRESTAG